MTSPLHEARARVTAAALAFLLAVALLAGVPAPPAVASQPGVVAPPQDVHGYEIWALDQGTGLDRIHVYDPSLREIAVIELGGHLSTPHMVDFDSEYRYAFVAGTAGGGVAVIRTADYTLVDVVATGPGAHMAAVTPDDSAVWVANIGARTFTEIAIDLDAETFALSGRELEVDGDPEYEAWYGPWRDDDSTPAPPAPVCHQYTADGRFAYVTLGPGPGGLVVVDIDAAVPQIVEAFDPGEVGANCGLARSHDGAKMYANSGSGEGGTWYVFDTSDHSLVGEARDPRGIDPHGTRITPDGRELWMVNRTTDNTIVVDTATDEVVDEIDFVGETPDILDFSPDGTRAFVSLRGPNPVSMPHLAVGETPGFAVIDVASRELLEIVEPAAGTDDHEASDFHGIGVRVLPGALTRLSGGDRIATSVAVSRDGFDDGEAGGAVLARADDYPDALTGTPLATAVGGPLLLTHSASLPEVVAAELQRAVAAGATVHLLGGTVALSAEVEAAVEGLGFAVERHAGTTRVETSVAVAERLGHPDTTLLASAGDFPDALAAGAAAAAHDGAVLLTTPDRPHPAVDAYLAAHAGQTIAVGGPAARAYPAVEAVSGADRHATAVAVATRFFPGAGTVAVARSGLFPDALSGGARAAALGAPVLLSPSASVHPEVADHLCRHAAKIGGGVAFGGTAALQTPVLAALANRLAGSGCADDVVIQGAASFTGVPAVTLDSAGEQRHYCSLHI